MAVEVDLPDPDLVTEEELDAALGSLPIPTTPVFAEGQRIISVANGRAVITARSHWSIENGHARYYPIESDSPPGTRAIADFGARTLTDPSQLTNWRRLDGGSDVVVFDASTTVKGIIQLAGDLAGTATSPTVPALTGINSSISAINTALGNKADTSVLALKANTTDVNTALSNLSSSLAGILTNETSIALGANATFTGEPRATGSYTFAIVRSKGTQPFTLQFEDSTDGITFSTAAVISAVNSGSSYFATESLPIIAPYLRIVVVNGSTAQASFRADLAMK